MRAITNFVRHSSNLVTFRYFYERVKLPQDILENVHERVVRAKSFGFEKHQVNDLALTVKTSLETKASEGCAESLNIIKSMSNFARQSSVLDFYGFDKAAEEGVYAMEFCSNVLMALCGYDYSPASKIKAVEEKKVSLPPHIDGGVGSNVEAISLMGIQSSGQVKTYAISAKQVAEKLSPEALEILSAKIFKHKRLNENFTMFEKMPDGSVTTKFSSYINTDLNNFDLPLKNDEQAQSTRLFTYDAKKIQRSNEDVEKAMEEGVKVLSELWEERQIKEMSVKTGSIILINNRTVFHGRGSYADRNSDIAEKLQEVSYKTRQVTRCFYVKGDQVFEFVIPKSSSAESVATKLSNQQQTPNIVGLH